MTSLPRIMLLASIALLIVSVSVSAEIKPFIIAKDNEDRCERARLAILPSGNVLILYEQSDGNWIGKNVLKIRFGEQLDGGVYQFGPPKLVTAPQMLRTFSGDIAAAPGGDGFLLVWSGNAFHFGRNDIFSRRVDERGNLGEGIVLVSKAEQANAYPLVANDPETGGYLVAYFRIAKIASHSAIAVQYVNAEGKPGGNQYLGPFCLPDNRLHSFVLDSLYRRADGSYYLGLTSRGLAFDAATLALIEAGEGVSRWTSCTYVTCESMDIAPVSADKFLAAYTTEFSEVTPQKTYYSLVDMHGPGWTRRHEISPPLVANALRFVPDSDGSGTALFFASGNRIYRQRFSAEGKPEGTQKALCTIAPFTCSSIRAVSIPGLNHVFAVMTVSKYDQRRTRTEVWGAILPQGR